MVETIDVWVGIDRDHKPIITDDVYVHDKPLLKG